MRKNTSKKSEKNEYINPWANYFIRNTLKEYPVSILYCEPSKMYSGMQRIHWHDEFEINYVRSGSVIYSIGDTSIKVNSGEAILIGGGRLHSAIDIQDMSDFIKPNDTEPASVISIMFNPEFIFSESDSSMMSMKYLNPLLSKDFKYMLFSSRNSDGLNEINDLIRTNLDKSYGYELMSKGLLCSLWLKVVKQFARQTHDKNAENAYYDEERIKRAIKYISENYTAEITLDQIAESVPVSKSECCRCFKRVTGGTPFEYIMSERVLHAALTLQHPDANGISMQEIATQTGFNNASYFNKTFKKYTGETPSQYRDNIKRNHRDALSPLGIPM